jgi:Type IV secretion system pilin
MKKAFMGAATLALLTVLSFPSFVSAATGSVGSCKTSLQNGGVDGLISCITSFFNAAIYLIMAFSVVYIVYGAFKLMNEEKRDEGKQTVYYGIIALFVMMSIWGFVNILNNTFGLSKDAPTTQIKLIP